MIELFCVLDPFQYIQTIKVKIDGKEDNNIFSEIDTLPDVLNTAAKQKTNSKIYLSGSSEVFLLPLKEEILKKSQTEYSNNNIEVILV